MEFCLRQTPRFTLPSPVTQKEAPRARHHELVANIQWESAAPKHSKPERAPGHSHHRHHLRSPFHHDGPHHHHRSAPDEQRQVQLCLPFIPPEDVAKANGEDNSPLWIVIDDIVYDVTEFAKRHPGGQMPLRNLAGQSCSWQFHRIHGKQTLERYGPELRIGRTSNVLNPFKEEKPTLFRQLWGSHSF